MNAEANRAQGLHHSDWAVARGATTAVLVSYVLSIALMLLSNSLWNAIQSGYPPDFGSLSIVIPFAILAAPIGLPVAIIVMAIGVMFWSINGDQGRTGYRDAARAGIKTAVIVVLFEVGGVLVYSASSVSYNSGLPWIWAKFAADAIATLGIGALTGVTARFAAGPPTVANAR